MSGALQGKAIVVAGAGGIGGELARRYAAEDASVLLGDVDLHAAEFVVREIIDAGGRALAIALDGADDTSVAACIAKAQEAFGGIDGFHANFGIFRTAESRQDVLELSLETYDEVMRINARGFVLCTRHAVPALLARGGGTLLYTGSGAAYMGEPVRLAYAMAKSAIHSLMRHVGTRFGPQGIRANVISPGVIIHERLEPEISPAALEQYKRSTALKTRLGRPSDVAAVSALLMSDEGGFITGQVIGVDGGSVMRP